MLFHYRKSGEDHLTEPEYMLCARGRDLKQEIMTEQKQLKNRRGFTIWFTGLSAAGKSTLAVALKEALYVHGCSSYVLDGDNLRHGLNKDLGFSPEERSENIRRIAEVAKLFRDAGVLNLIAVISPYRSDRELARKLAEDEGDTFIEVFINCPVGVCEQRDPKGIYTKARAGAIKDFTGISASYEKPEKSEIHLRTDKETVDECVKTIMRYLIEHSCIPPSPIMPV